MTTIITNPAAIGARWTEGNLEIELAVSRPGGTVVMFAMRTVGDDKWSPVSTVAQPERFGPIPTDTKSMRAYADAFQAGEPHVDYPHEPGYLYDCPACEWNCHCTPGNAECVSVGPHRDLGPARRRGTTEPQPWWWDLR